MKKLLFVIVSMLLLVGISTVTQAKDVAEQGSRNYSVVFKSDEIPSDFNEQIEKLGAEVVYSVPEVGFVQIKGNADLLAQVKELKSVQVINPALSWSFPESQKINLANEEVSELPIQTESNFIDRPFWGLQWDVQRITQGGMSYELGTGSHNVVVGIIDTGIDRDHPDLVQNLLPGSKNFVPAGGFRGTEPEETGDPNAFDDRDGHGSHVAGSIAANGYLVGVAPNVGIRSYRVFGTSFTESGWIINAVISAANDGVDVLSMSLGGFDIIGQVFYIDPITGEKTNIGNDVADYIAYKRAIKYATNRGSLVVTSAGNDALNCTNKKEVTDFLNEEYGGDGWLFVGAGFTVPAIFPEVITVSATGPDDIFASYSNYGPGFIDVATVGGDSRIYEQYLSEGRLDEYFANRLYYYEFCLSTSQDGWYYFSTGTSMAAPKVSAVAALIIDKYGEMSPSQVKRMLLKYGVDPIRGTEKIYFGKGNLNAYKALNN